jgi:hypothetical protein
LTGYCALLALLLTIPAGNAQAPSGATPDLIVTQAPYHHGRTTVVKGALAFRNTRPEGARIVRATPGKPPRVLTAGFASACDPSLSFDAAYFLFAAKRTTRDTWGIYEMPVDGGEPRQLVADMGNCGEPRYLARGSITPPEFEDKVRWIAFTSDAAGVYEEQTDRLATAVYVRNIEPIAVRGTVTRRTTFNLSSDFSPTVLRDGRVLFTSHQPSDGPEHPFGRFPLMLANWDGTGLNVFYGNSDGAVVNTMPAELPDRTLAFVESDGDSENGAGRLVRVSFKRPLHSLEKLSRAPGLYRSPVSLGDGSLLVSYAPARASYGIFRFDFQTGAPGQKVVDDPKWNELQAVPVETRPEPTGLLSAVVDSATTGDLQCMSVFESDTPEPPKKGEVKTARFVEGVPVPAHEPVSAPMPGARVPSNLRTRILGEVPVEADGSFYVTVPGDTPFFVQLLDGRGMAVKNMRGWMWVRKGTSRGCIGCHENKELAPENRTTAALIKHNPAALTEPEAQRRSVDFRKDISALLQSRCASCHGGKSPRAGIQLSRVPAGPVDAIYQTLLSGAPVHDGKGAAAAPFVVPGSARKSLLSQIIGAVPASQPGASEHPPVPLTDDERRTIVQWIDLGARWAN